MIIQFSPFAYNVIQHYKNCLMLSKYHCTEERANGKAQEMVDYIIGKVSDTTIELQECPYVKLGKKNGAKGNAFNKMLKWFQYKVSANNAWGVSVLYDENGNALVYRIVHCKYLKEPSPGWKQQSNSSQQDKQKVKESAKWIPIQDLNKQIQEENTMKWKKLVNESQVDFELDYWVQDKISQAFDQFVQDKEYPATAQLKVYVGLYKTPKMDDWKIYRHARDTYEDAQEDIKSAKMDAKKHNIVDVQFKIEEITIDVSKRIETVYEG